MEDNQHERRVSIFMNESLGSEEGGGVHSRELGRKDLDELICPTLCPTHVICPTLSVGQITLS